MTTDSRAGRQAELFFRLHELQTCSWGISKIGRVAQRIDASEGLLYSEFDTNLLSLTTIPVIGFWKLLPTFGGCVVTVSSAAYDAAMSDLRASYESFARAVEAASNSRNAQSRLDEHRRRRGLDAREFESAGTFSSLAQARKLGELNGALTRVRQMLCSPFAVNADKAKAGKHAEAAAILRRVLRVYV